MSENPRRETLIVRRPGYRWALAAAYVSMLVILAVTLSGTAFDGSGISKYVATRSTK